jgi:P-type Mg2+ transporter
MNQQKNNLNKFPNIFDYTIKGEKDGVKEFKTNSIKGISEKEAKVRILEYGKNILTTREIKWWHILLRQFKSAFIYLLFAAVIITLLLGQYVESGMIFLFLLINTGLGFYQEFRSEKTILLLRRYILSYAKVVRDGQTKRIASNNLVPGDIVVLETGDIVPADVRFLEIEGLLVDETVLTGESTPVYKKVNRLSKKAEAYHESLNIGFSGTLVVKGRAKALVLATGNNAAIGRIAKLSSETRSASNFEKGISHFTAFILKLAGLTLALVFLANVLVKRGNLDFIELVIFLIALTVSVIPEALPVVTTFSLSQGARRLAKLKVVVKRLSAVEDLGGIEILCSDKTGTLTENKLEVVDIYSKNSKKTLYYAALCTAFEQRKKKEPFDIAIWKKLNKDQIQEINLCRKLKEIPFNPEMKRNIVLATEGKKANLAMVTLGAPEEIIKLCQNLNKLEETKINQWINQEGKKGNRILVIAEKHLKKQEKESLKINAEKENNFNFLGIISFADSIKKTTDGIVRQANKLGVKIKIITGDSREVAGNVAFQIGLIDLPEKVITGKEWNNFNEKQKLKAMEEYQVFARFSPEQKYSLVEKLKSKYRVGFLGEGINDAPVLKLSDVSLVVESGADIAKETADIVLLKKDLRAILNGIEEGRRVFANTIKYIKITLISNFGNFFAIATASLLIDFLPMLPLQILLVNLLSDIPMIAVSTDTVNKKELQTPQKYNIKDIAFFCIILGVLSTLFDFIFFGLFYRISPQVLQTNWFIGSILTELVLIFSIRTKMFFTKTKRPSGIVILFSLIAASTTIVLPFTLLGQKIFNFIRPENSHFVIVISLVITYFFCSEILKLFYYKKFNNK